MPRCRDLECRHADDLQCPECLFVEDIDDQMNILFAKPVLVAVFDEAIGCNWERDKPLLQRFKKKLLNQLLI